MHKSHLDKLQPAFVQMFSEIRWQSQWKHEQDSKTEFELKQRFSGGEDQTQLGRWFQSRGPFNINATGSWWLKEGSYPGKTSTWNSLDINSTLP